MHALADEILRYREALRLLAEAIGWGRAVRVDHSRSLLASEARGAKGYSSR